MRTRNIMTRLFGLVGLSAASLLILSVIAAHTLKDELLRVSIAKAMSLAEVARSTAEGLHARAVKGEFDDATAQALAKAAIRSMRYDGDGYFFVYDDAGTNVVHGSKPEREGKNYLDTKDTKGYAYLPDMIRLAQSGGGHLFYWFPKPGSTEPARKVSSAVGYAPWHWMIGTGIYLDDIDAQFWHLIRQFVAIAGLAAVLVSVIALRISRSIASPLHQLADVTARIGNGTYNVEVPVTDRTDEIGTLAGAVLVLRDTAKAAEQLRAEQAAEKLRHEAERRASVEALADQFEGHVSNVVETIVTSVSSTTEAARTMDHLAADAAGDAAQVAGVSARVNANIQTVAAATEELSISIREISGQVQSSNSVADKAAAKADDTNRRIQGLTDVVGRIGEVVHLISDIANQTNLLALNATIEAARAGDAGKGFAVVAGEVKSLANQTARATEDITAQIGALQAASSDAVAAIREITQVIGTLSGTSTTIAAAIEEQSAATAEISRNVQEAAGGAHQVSEVLAKLADVVGGVGGAAAVVSRSSAQLSDQSDALRRETSAFLADIRA